MYIGWVGKFLEERANDLVIEEIVDAAVVFFTVMHIGQHQVNKLFRDGMNIGSDASHTKVSSRFFSQNRNESWRLTL